MERTQNNGTKKKLECNKLPPQKRLQCIYLSIIKIHVTLHINNHFTKQHSHNQKSGHTSKDATAILIFYSKD